MIAIHLSGSVRLAWEVVRSGGSHVGSGMLAADRGETAQSAAVVTLAPTTFRDSWPDVCPQDCLRLSER
jgi:hypothetical protein